MGDRATTLINTEWHDDGRRTTFNKEGTYYFRDCKHFYSERAKRLDGRFDSREKRSPERWTAKSKFLLPKFVRSPHVGICTGGHKSASDRQHNEGPTGTDDKQDDPSE
jgi:hypothetical protein